MKDCTTCKYGYEDERLGIPMCHHPKRFSEDCIDFNMHEEKETEESEKPINPADAMKELEEKIALVKQRRTWDGVDVDKYMDEVRGRSEIPNDLEEAAIQYATHKKKSEEEEMETELPMGEYYLAKDSFIAGAGWQKSQMMKDAVEGEVENATLGIVYLRKNLVNEGYSTGDKVRIIILKENEK